METATIILPNGDTVSALAQFNPGRPGRGASYSATGNIPEYAYADFMECIGQNPQDNKMRLVTERGTFLVLMKSITVNEFVVISAGPPLPE